MDPISTGMLLDAGSKVLAGALGGSGPAAPSGANGNAYDVRFDSSGWNVNFGSGAITAERTSSEASGPASGNLSSLWILALVAGVVLWKLSR